jgi:hypothetical protein
LPARTGRLATAGTGLQAAARHAAILTGKGRGRQAVAVAFKTGVSNAAAHEIAAKARSSMKSRLHRPN